MWRELPAPVGRQPELAVEASDEFWRGVCCSPLCVALFPFESKWMSRLGLSLVSTASSGFARMGDGNSRYIIPLLKILALRENEEHNGML